VEQGCEGFQGGWGGRKAGAAVTHSAWVDLAGLDKVVAVHG